MRLRRLSSPCPHKWKLAKRVAGVRLCDGRQLFDPSLIVWPGQDGPIGVNVIHREEKGDSFHFGP